MALTKKQAAALEAIRDEPGIDLETLAFYLATTPSGAGRVTQALVQGYLIRRDSWDGVALHYVRKEGA